MVKGLQLLIAATLIITGCGNAKFGFAPQNASFGQKVLYNTQVDILLVVDSSGSMGSKQAQLAASFPSFIDYMVASQFDFNIAVTTMDMGNGGAKGAFVGSPKVLNRHTPNLRQSFINNVSQGTSGSDLSRGLEAMKSALSDNMLAGTNSGFFRPDALLAVIFLSDEDDGSVGGTKGFIDFMDGKKPAFPWGYRGWVANSIVVPNLSGQCLTYNQFASPGLRYMELSNVTGGVIASICDADLVQATASLRARIAEMLTQFHLNPPADVNTIKVFVNGVEIPQSATNGWTYDAGSANVMFHGPAVPQANANVQISYTPISVK